MVRTCTRHVCFQWVTMLTLCLVNIARIRPTHTHTTDTTITATKVIAFRDCALTAADAVLADFARISPHHWVLTTLGIQSLSEPARNMAHGTGFVLRNRLQLV